MGNAALEVLSDITEDGNRWKEVKLPTHAEVLNSDQRWAESSPSRETPRLLVAPVASALHRDNIAAWEASLADRFGSCPGDQPVPVRTTSGALVTLGGRTFDVSERPSQVVLEPGASVHHRPGLRPASRFCWRPLGACHAMRKQGTLLTEARLMELRPHLPVATRLASCWKLIYTPAVHGVSLRTFYRQCNSWPGETLLLVEDTEGHVFGCFASHTWQVAGQRQHFGDAECFVFSFGAPEESHPLAVYQWAGGNMYFMYADLSGFSMGGGLAPALYIRHDFLTGASCRSATFGTQGPLSSKEEFVIRRLECWTFDHSSAAAAVDLQHFRDQWEGLGSAAAAAAGSPASTRGPEDSGEEASPMKRAVELRSSAQDMLRYRFG